MALIDISTCIVKQRVLSKANIAQAKHVLLIAFWTHFRAIASRELLCDELAERNSWTVQSAHRASWTSENSVHSRARLDIYGCRAFLIKKMAYDSHSKRNQYGILHALGTDGSTFSSQEHATLTIWVRGRPQRQIGFKLPENLIIHTCLISQPVRAKSVV